MRLFAKNLLTISKSLDEQHIVNLSYARLENFTYNEDFSIINCSNSTASATGYIYFYMDDQAKYKPYCYDSDGITKLNVSGTTTSSRYAVTITSTNYDVGTYTFRGGVREVATGKVVQKFKIIYTKK